jgi:CheY-like chemotaxis protein
MFGQMHVESQLGEGSCFSFQLPFALADGQEPEPRLWPEESQHGALAVIPNETTAAAFVRLLEQQQMACRTVRSVEEAQSLLKQGGTGKTDIVFVDQAETEDLPAAVEQLRACTGNGTLPVVLLIASDTFHASEKARKIDVNGYLTKPVKKSALLSLLRRVYELEARPAGKKLPRGRQHDWSSIKGIKVILAEDNPINQEVALENLRSVGVVADIAQDGMQVMKMVSEGNYDAVLMDIQMPDMDGFEATRKVRQSESVHHGIPIIAMTAHAMSGDREKCLDAGMNGYVTKPIDPEKMFAELDRCVAQARTAALGVESAASREEVPQSPAETVHDRMGIEPIAPAPEMTYTEDGFPELEGFDVRAGLLRVRNNQELYTRLLTDFARREGDICKHIRAAWEDRQVDQVRKQAHMLKGTAGNLAATALHQAARNLESALKDKHFQDVEVRITQLQEAMSQTMDSIDWLAAMQQEDESDAGAVAEMTIDVEKQMQTLYNLLQKGSVDAETVMQSLQTAFEKAQVRDQARKLEQQMADFDYTGACETLENMAKKMGYTLIGQNK